MKNKKLVCSPVVKASVKWKNSPPYSWIDVHFASPKEIDSFIEALEFLKDSKGGEPDHVHLQDKRLKPGSIIGSEIIFHRPKKKIK